MGSEFWNLPQRLGDELSGITATLTRTQRGDLQAIARITQPQSTRLESGTHGCGLEPFSLRALVRSSDGSMFPESCGRKVGMVNLPIIKLCVCVGVGNLEGSGSRAWSRSQYLSEVQQELQGVLTDQIFSTPVR